MAYDEELADRIRSVVQGLEGVAEKKMFGGLAFLVGGNLAVAASGQGGLMLRCDPAETASYVEHDGVARMEMKGRELDGWLRVAPDVADDESALQRWVDVGVGYARSLPAK